ncbi:MAG: hypothetical protein ACRC0S_02180 [Fusobacteriaceae bacterium]
MWICTKCGAKGSIVYEGIEYILDKDLKVIVTDHDGYYCEQCDNYSDEITEIAFWKEIEGD